MKYKWTTIGDQDEKYRWTCPLGPYLLEMIESGWEISPTDNDIMLVEFNVFLWNNSLKKYERVDSFLKPQPYNRITSRHVLENWYACNVLLEEQLGVEDEAVQD